jgi:acyl-CoA hydrolase
MSTHWETFYAERKTTLEKALQVVKNGSRVFLGTACAEPQYLVQGLIDRANLSDVQILHFIALGNKSYTEKRFDNRFRHNALLVGPNTRDATANNTMLCLVTLTTPNGRGFTK